MPAPCETGGGCAIASGGATPHGWILLAAAVWLLRRRRC
jgi:MYXO-CTERM domain-containing protein